MNKTLARIGIALITNMTSTATTYEDILWLESEKAGGREYVMNKTAEPTEIWVDGKPVVSVVDNAGYTGSVTLLDIIDDIAIKLFGCKRTATGGIVDDDGITVPPHFAFLAAQETLNGNKKYQVDIFYNTVATPADRSGKTIEGKGFDPDFPEIPLVSHDRLDGKGSHAVEYYDELPTSVPEPVLAAAQQGND